MQSVNRINTARPALTVTLNKMLTALQPVTYDHYDEIIITSITSVDTM